jgi:hypothetical protein
MTDPADLALMETSLAALGDAYDGLAGEVMAALIAALPAHDGAFLNPAAAQERMLRETLDALLGLAGGEWWVTTTVTSFVDLHRNFDAFSGGDYVLWFDLVLAAMERRTGKEWPAGASTAWARQVRGLTQLIDAELSRVAA